MRFMTWCVLAILFFDQRNAVAESNIGFKKRDGVLVVTLGSVEIASYVFQDPQVPHPYFAQVKTPAGIQVTRTHPPVKGTDAVDHAGIHTGIWHSFGDLSGHDFWRLKARTEHVRFVTEPTGGPQAGRFTVLNRYLTTDGTSTLCEETCQYVIRNVGNGYSIEIATEFRPQMNAIVFGDQEEMGLGIRLATPLAVDQKQGGRILDSAGRRNGKEVWGKTSEWCDYSGNLAGKWVGMTVLSAPENFRPSWNHARDYGFLAVNPFGRHSFTGGAASQVVIKPGETLKLRFAVVVHETTQEKEYIPGEEYAKFATRKSMEP